MADRLDPSTYALTIQLQVDAANAFSTIGQFETSIRSLETQVAAAAKQALGVVNTMATQVAHSTETFLADFTQVKHVSTDLFKKFKPFYDQYEETTDHVEEQLDNLKLTNKQYQLMKQTQTALIPIAKGGLTHVDSFLKTTEGIILAVKRKNQAHIEQNELVYQGIKPAEIFRDLIVQTGERVGDLATSTVAAGLEWYALVRMIRAAADDAERFHTINFRVYGSQMEILDSTRRLTAQYGMLHEEAVQAYEAMGNLAVPTYQLHGYATTIAMVNRITGLSIPTLAQYNRQLINAGLNSTQIRAHTERLVEAMRRFSLSTQDMNSIMNDTATSGWRLSQYFGDPEAIAHLNELKATFGGYGKQIGLTQEEVNQSINSMVNDANSFYFAMNRLGRPVQSVEDMGQALALAGADAAAVMEKYKGLKGSLDMGSYEAMLKGEARAIGLNSEASLRLAARIHEVAKERNLDMKQIQDYRKVMELMKIDLDQAFDKANKTLPRQLAMLASSVANLFGMLFSPLIKVLIEVLSYVNAGLLKVQQWVQRLSDWFESSIAPIRGLGMVIKTVLAVAIIYVSGIIMRYLINRLTSWGSVLSNFFVGIGRGVGGAIRAILQPLTGFTRELLVLSIFLAAAGISAYLFGAAVEKIANVGWGAVGAVAALGVGLAVAIGTLMLVATLGAPAVPVLLAIGAALLMIGAAAWLTAKSVEIIAGVFGLLHEKVTEPGSPPLYAVLPLLATGFNLIGLAIAPITSLVTGAATAFRFLVDGLRSTWTWVSNVVVAFADFLGITTTFNLVMRSADLLMQSLRRLWLSAKTFITVLLKSIRSFISWISILFDGMWKVFSQITTSVVAVLKQFGFVLPALKLLIGVLKTAITVLTLFAAASLAIDLYRLGYAAIWAAAVALPKLAVWITSVGIPVIGKLLLPLKQLIATFWTWAVATGAGIPSAGKLLATLGRLTAAFWAWIATTRVATFASEAFSVLLNTGIGRGLAGLATTFIGLFARFGHWIANVRVIELAFKLFGGRAISLVLTMVRLVAGLRGVGFVMRLLGKRAVGLIPIVGQVIMVIWLLYDAISFVYSYWGDFTAFLGRQWQKISGWFDGSWRSKGLNLITSLANGFMAGFGYFSGLFSGLLGWLGAKWGEFTEWLGAKWGDVVGWFGTKWAEFTGWFDGSWLERGRQLIITFADGIEGGFDYLKDKLTDVFSYVRSFLPFSDAKRGPLSELSTSGAALITTLAGGVSTGAPLLFKAMRWLVGGASTQLNELNNLELMPTAGLATDGLIKDMARVQMAIESFDGVEAQLDESLGNTAKIFQRYAGLIDRSSTRIQEAISGKVISSIKAAQQAGIEEGVRAQTISTVKVYHETQGDRQTDQVVTLLEQQNAILQELSEKIQGTGSDDLVVMRRLLENYLPHLAQRNQGNLHSDFNEWMN